MSLTKRIFDSHQWCESELTNSSVVQHHWCVQVPFLLSIEESACIEREQAFNHAIEGLQRMKAFWKSGDEPKRALVMRYCSDVQEWLNFLYFDSDFLSFGSDEDYMNPEPDYNNLAREMDERPIETMWEVFHA
jgi:hypothetical protein